MWKVEEIYEAGKRALQPGWDYVVDTGFDPSKAPIQPINKKRTAGRGGGDTTAKQNDATLRRLRELQKDNSRDAVVPTISRNKGKTPNTRKVLTYQKAFQGWLEQEKADTVKSAQNPVQQKPKPTVHPRKGTGNIMSKIKIEAVEEPTPPVALRTASDGTDDSHLLQTIIPSLPSEAEMERLCSAPPLSYEAARAGPSVSGRPALHFCEVCGYWGKIKCIMCGVRVCGLNCKRKHDVECQNYGRR